jgi:hypothetical protein
VLFLIIVFAERTVEDDADGGWTETLTDATGSCGSGAAAADDAVEAAAGGMAAVSVSQSDEVDFDDIPDADDEAAAVSLEMPPTSSHSALRMIVALRSTGRCCRP